MDDDPSVLGGLRRLLVSMGVEMQGFASAEAFLAHPRRAERACLILDIKLPGMDGLELQRRLARDNGELPIIMLSACTDSRLVRQALAGGAVSFVTKPVNAAELQRAVCQALG